jgi:GH35 family endo-1,4-beta-xylanase
MVMRNWRGMPLGTCTHPSYLLDERHWQILVDDYQMITPEVAGGYWWVYGGPISGEGHGWDDMDWLVQWAANNGKQMHYHCLRWWWEDQPADPLGWIEEAMRRYPGIMEWIVVNEGWCYTGATIPLIDESYIKAREIANKLAEEREEGEDAPKRRLWYNGLFIRENENEEVKRLVEMGLVDAVGIQMHIDLNEDFDIFIPFLWWLKKNGVPWRISEMDVAIPDMSDANLAAQAGQYARSVDLLGEFGGESHSTWGPSDDRSWLAKSFPTPRDIYVQPKPAWEVLRGSG